MNRFILIYLLSFSSFANAQDIRVTLEPFPPIINTDGSGVLIDMFEAISVQSNLNFDIQIATYERAKIDLINGDIDLIGLTPKMHETSSFYQHANELDWFIQTTVDVFSTNKDNLSLENIPNKSIGTLVGNAEFMAEMTNISRDKFIEVSNLGQLAKMLVKGRIEYAIFERVSMMTTISRMGLPVIHYRKLRILPASLAVRNDKDGNALKRTLDSEFAKLNTNGYMKLINHFNRLPSIGIVSTAADKKKLN